MFNWKHILYTLYSNHLWYTISLFFFYNDFNFECFPLLYLFPLYYYLKVFTLISLHFLSMSNMASTMPVLCDSPYWHVKSGWLFLFFSISSLRPVGFISFMSIIWVPLHHLWHTIRSSVFSLLISCRAAIVSIIFQKNCLQLKWYFSLFDSKTFFSALFLLSAVTFCPLFPSLLLLVSYTEVIILCFRIRHIRVGW